LLREKLNHRKSASTTLNILKILEIYKTQINRRHVKHTFHNNSYYVYGKIENHLKSESVVD
jgi:hypothetical protein